MNSYRKDIQGLRAIAVLFVFIFHLNKNWLPGGFVGVDIFFVISGYLISSIILSKINKDQFSFFDFYISRIKRIVPAYYVLLVVTIIVGAFVFLFGDFIYTLRLSYLNAAIFNSNNWFASLNTYFGTQNAENPFLHTWTLAVEMQFYLFLPFLLFFINRRWLLSTILLLTVALLTYSSIRLYMGDKDKMYFSLLARTPEFMIGVLASLIAAKRFAIFQKQALVISIIGFVLLGISAIFINESSSFPGVLACLPCVGAALLLLTAQNSTTEFLSSSPMVYIGELSYSVYLWHWPIMAFVRYYYSRYAFTTIEYFLIIVATFVFSSLSYYGIEKTTRKSNNKKLVLSITCFSVVVLIMFFSSRSINKTIGVNIPATYTGTELGNDSHGESFKEVETFGDTSATDSLRILLVGDSHALFMITYFDFIGKQEKFKFRTISNSVYPLIPGLSGNPFDHFFKSYEKLIKIGRDELEKADIIILQMFVVEGDCHASQIEDLTSKMRPNQYFILLSDVPNFSVNPLRVNRNFIKRKHANFLANYTKVDEKLLKVIASHQNCYYLNLQNCSDVFKDAPFYHDTLMYWDPHHLNTFGSLAYAKETEKEAMKVLNEIFEKYKTGSSNK